MNAGAGVLAGIVLAWLTWSAEGRAEDGATFPSEQPSHRVPRHGLIVAGVIAGGGGHVLAATMSMFTSISCPTSDDARCPSGASLPLGFVPIVGPFIVAASEDVQDDAAKVAIGSFGLLQIGGLATSIVGAALTEPADEEALGFRFEAGPEGAFVLGRLAW